MNSSLASSSSFACFKTPTSHTHTHTSRHPIRLCSSTIPLSLLCRLLSKVPLFDANEKLKCGDIGFSNYWVVSCHFTRLRIGRYIAFCTSSRFFCGHLETYCKVNQNTCRSCPMSFSMFTIRLEAVAIRLEAIAIRSEALAMTSHMRNHQNVQRHAMTNLVEISRDNPISAVLDTFRYNIGTHRTT